MHAKLRLTVTVVFLVFNVVEIHGQVPGMVHTNSGYDVLGGTDALCWWAPSFHDCEELFDTLGEQDNDHAHNDHTEIADFKGRIWENSMISGFQAGPTTLLGECPGITSMHIHILREKVADSELLRTNRYYRFHIEATIDLGALRQGFELSDDSFFTSENGIPRVGMRIEFCPVRTTRISTERKGHFYRIVA